ncbi:MAG: hypothetical protein K2K44_11810 [Oscillospiraceae bacterium]|nr:hypothetical protein [Oscillospiraceae bacterium]
MVVQHNLTAMNANRYLGINNTKLSKSLEKLSSGYAINRAGDNAAGLAVSEKMRSQIAGMQQGVKNAQDAISMIQTYEGALTETDSILQRMKVLADQAGNGTYADEVDRDAINLEFNQLNDELNQIADTDFNGVTALNGGVMSDGTVANNANVISNRPTINYTQNGKGSSAIVYSESVNGTIDTSGNGTVSVNGVKVKVTGGEAEYTPDGANEKYLGVEITGSSYTVTGLTYENSTYGGEIEAVENLIVKAGETTATINGMSFDVKWNADGEIEDLLFKDAVYDEDGEVLYEAGASALDAADYTGFTAETINEDTDGTDEKVTGFTVTSSYEVDETTGAVINTGNNKIVGSIAISSGVSTPDAYQHGAINLTYANSITFQVGARSKDAVKFNFAYTTNGIGNLKADLDASARGLGTDQLTLATQEEANFAVDKIDNAINKVSMIRATFGAAQNRLEHKIDNLNVSVENLTSAESQIRDTDMPTEMMNFTKQQILAQASQSMLAQANQLPQGVLSLLQ